MLTIETNPKRYARPEFIDAVVDDTPIPMVVDAELGMPLDLSLWDCLWDEAADEDDLNPSSDPMHLPQLDPADEYLAADWTGPATQSSAMGVHSTVASGSATGNSTPVAQSIPWLRRTEYITGSSSASKPAIVEQLRTQAPPVDISHAAQIASIEGTFASCNESFHLDSLVHPLKKGLKAVDSYEILPDADIWENAYDLFRFAERPGERPNDTEDPRLDCAILRPMESDGDHFLAYYLTETDEAALEFKERRAAVAPYQIQEEEWETVYQFVRDYETVMIEKEVPNEFLLLLEEGASPDQRARGAYYKSIERKMILKKRRANLHEEYQDKWEIIRLTHAAIGPEEVDERDDARAEVLDPMFTVRLMSGRGDADADADGEIDQDAVPVHV